MWPVLRKLHISLSCSWGSVKAGISCCAVTAALVPKRKPSDPAWIELYDAMGIVLVWPSEFDQLARHLSRGADRIE